MINPPPSLWPMRLAITLTLKNLIKLLVLISESEAERYYFYATNS
jgi:hypothetical protein